MVQQVPQIILRDELQCNGFMVADAALRFELGRRQVRNDVGEIEVVTLPERDEERPRGVLDSLDAHAAVLFVTGKVERALQGGADEPLVIVRRGIDEVADHLFSRPAAFQDWRGGIGVRNLCKNRLGGLNYMLQLFA